MRCKSPSAVQHLNEENVEGVTFGDEEEVVWDGKLSEMVKQAVTDEPGWGIEIHPEWLARSQYQITQS